MKRYIGGYAILDLTSETIYNDALTLANVDKPILIYPENDKPVFADTFEIDSDNNVVIITIGGQTITIANDNTITTSGVIQNHLYIYQLDLSGATLASDIGLPNGYYSIAVYSNVKLDDSKPLPEGKYICFNSCYEINSSTNNIFEIEYSNNQLEVVYDGNDDNSRLATSYDGSIYNEFQLF